MRMDRENNSSWDSSLAGTFASDQSSSSSEVNVVPRLPLDYAWTGPPTPSLDSDQSSSRLSVDSNPESELDELPEIPVISAAHHHRGKSLEDYAQDDQAEHAFWSNIVRPSLSRSSAERLVALLGHTNSRVLSPSRQRVPSVSSNASSRSKPAPAKSILSSGSSVKTRRGRSPPSVKFLDRPTIHYDIEDEFECLPEPRHIPEEEVPVVEKKRRFDFIRRFIGGSSNGKKPRAEPDRPVISGPFPLCDAPRSIRRGGSTASRSNSIRSVKSQSSLRSIRSCGSRLQNYWGRMSGKDP